MTTNIKQALKLEDDFVINFVDEVNNIEYDYDITNFFEATTSTVIKQFIKLFPHQATKLQANSFKALKRSLLIEEASNLSIKEVKELIDASSTPTAIQSFRSQLFNFLSLGFYNWVAISLINYYFKVDISNLTKEEDKLLVRALVYLTLLYKTDDTAN